MTSKEGRGFMTPMRVLMASKERRGLAVQNVQGGERAHDVQGSGLGMIYET